MDTCCFGFHACPVGDATLTVGSRWKNRCAATSRAGLDADERALLALGLRAIAREAGEPPGVLLLLLRCLRLRDARPAGFARVARLCANLPRQPPAQLARWRAIGGAIGRLATEFARQRRAANRRRAAIVWEGRLCAREWLRRVPRLTSVLGRCGAPWRGARRRGYHLAAGTRVRR